MKKTALGLLLVVVTIPFMTINYIPHWLGYSLICWGLAQTPECPERTPGMAVAAASAILSAALWVAGLFGYGMTFPLDELLALFMTYRLLVWCEGQEALEGAYRLPRLRLSWYALAGTRAAAFLLGFVLPPLGMVWSLAALVAGLVYAVTFYRLLRLVPPQDGQGGGRA